MASELSGGPSSGSGLSIGKQINNSPSDASQQRRSKNARKATGNPYLRNQNLEIDLEEEKSEQD